jgi:AcrR family transcriptional regulator
VTNETARPKVGRPRAVSDPAPNTAPREQILLAAAQLFVEQGFEATTTRAIAEAVGMRQASLYYHFAGKDELLEELLELSVRPSVELARSIVVTEPAEAAEALYRLALADTRLLLESPHNIGSLYLLPEVSGPRFTAFREQRVELQNCYGHLGAVASRLAQRPDAVPGEGLLGMLVLQIVETVIPVRRSRAVEAGPPDLAVSCLRVCGLDERTIDRVVAAAAAAAAAGAAAAQL